MAYKIIRKPSDYFGETAYVYDIAQSSKYFDKSVYEGLNQSGNRDFVKNYLYGLYSAKDKEAIDFNQKDYDYLSIEDKAAYTLWALNGDKSETVIDEETGKEYNVWERNKAYFDSKVQEAVDKETYDSLNAFEKTMHSIGGIVGNALNETLVGTIEGLVDLGAVITGNKDWAATDFTGVGATREALQDYARKYTYLDKAGVWGVVNDVVTGLAQYSVALIPGAGPLIYFGAMAGNTAADAVRANPDIDYLSLIGYTAAAF